MASSPQSSALHHIRHHLLSDSADSTTASTSSPLLQLLSHAAPSHNSPVSSPQSSNSSFSPNFARRKPTLSIAIPHPSPPPTAADSGHERHYRGVRRRPWGNSQLRSATPTAEGLGFGLAPSTPPSRPPGPTTERPSGCAAAKRSSTSLLKPEHHQRLRSGTPAFGKG
ncbi:hypothetical protein CK203_105000 [Vitis vinifera]|uniref:Uncharacterized protein n=1 Tax=Vitis vinifera TaxID=29760 RepID=A0A438CWR1_VITVI|nr:hypothetical protein CK203_105000 [Vitis vinifera]